MAMERDNRAPRGRKRRKHRNQAPFLQAELFRIQRNLNLKQAIGQNHHADHCARHGHAGHKPRQKRKPHQAQKQPERQVKLERQPVQILRKITHHADHAAQKQPRAQKRLQQTAVKLRTDQQQHTQHSQKH